MRSTALLIAVTCLGGAMLIPKPMAHAAEACGPIADLLRLKLDTPFGCTTNGIFKKQIDNPADLKHPRAEREPDTARRIKSLSDWRTSKPADVPIADSPK